MARLKTICSVIRKPGKIFKPIASRGIFNWLPDDIYLKLLFRSEMGRRLNLDNPKTFNEKLQWLKLNDRNEEYIAWVDKETSKDKVAKIIGKEFVVPLVNAWDKAEDIDFNSLPEKCVLKCNHDQGSTIILDKSHSYNKAAIIQYFEKKLKKNAYRTTREWPYKNIVPRILCEQYLEDDIIDYKIFCFNGEPVFVNIGQKTQVDNIMHISFLDFEWNLMPFQRTDFPPVAKLPPKPANFEEMLAIARKLAKGTYFVRIDLFNTGGRIYFSEFTLYPTSGLIKFNPPEYDEILGSWLKIKGVGA